MKNSFYFPHDYDASTDKKVVQLRAKFGWEGYGVYWAIIEALAREDGSMDRGVIGVAIGDPNAKPIISYCLEIGLLKETKEGISSKRLNEHIEVRQKFVEAGKKGAKARWGNSSSKNGGGNGGGNANPNDKANAKERKGKERKGNNNIKGKTEKFVNKFNELFDRQFRVTTGRKRKLKTRLETYSIEQILKALENLSKSPWHRGVNDRGWQADPDFLIRNDEQIDKWLNKDIEEAKELSKLSRKAKNGQSKITRSRL